MDAYDGTMHFYVADPDDPIIRAYAGGLPDAVLADRPDAGRPARRTCAFPRSCSTSRRGCSGGITSRTPQQFFRNDDLWTVPTGTTSEQTLPSEAYYVVMRMPGECECRVPAAPADGPGQPAEHDRVGRRPQRRAELRDDPRLPVPGRLRRSSGPAQIEARIDQDPIISQQISLWNQSGSKVIRGNLIVVPLGESLIYLQPVYLQSTAVVVPGVPADRRRLATQRRLGADPRDGAIDLLLRAEANSGRRSRRPRPGRRRAPGASRPTPTPSSGPVEPLPSDVAGLIAYANAPLRPGPGRAPGRRLRHATARRSPGSRRRSIGSTNSRPGSACRPEPRPARRRDPGGDPRHVAARDARAPDDLDARAGRLPRPRRHRDRSWSRSSSCRPRSGSPT